MISCTVSGHLGRDAELRSAGGTQVLSFSIASSGFRNKEKVTDWVTCSMWGDRGAKIQQYLTKGTPVIVRGTMWIREYEAKDGTTKASLELRADDVEMVGGKSKEEGGERRAPSGGGGGGGGSSSRQQSKPRESAPADDFGGAGDDSDIPF